MVTILAIFGIVGINLVFAFNLFACTRRDINELRRNRELDSSRIESLNNRLNDLEINNRMLHHSMSSFTYMIQDIQRQNVRRRSEVHIGGVGRNRIIPVEEIERSQAIVRDTNVRTMSPLEREYLERIRE